MELLKNKLAIIILAAGKGTRMDSNKPKVLHKVNGKAMIEYAIRKAQKLNPEKIVVVIGYKAEKVREKLSDYKVEYALQKAQKGTGHAIMQCSKILRDFEGNTLILSGDVPLITEKTLENLYQTHTKEKAEATILATYIDNPYGYGRIIRNNNNHFMSIIEEKDASKEQKNIKEINAGIYIFNNSFLFENINKINNDNNQSEYYLPDIMSIIIGKNKKVCICSTINEYEIRGVNTIEQLNELKAYANKTQKKS